MTTTSTTTCPIGASHASRLPGSREHPCRCVCSLTSCLSGQIDPHGYAGRWPPPARQINISRSFLPPFTRAPKVRWQQQRTPIMRLRQLLSLGAATLASAQPNLAKDFKLMDDQSFEAPFDEVSAYTGMRDLTAFEVGGSAVVHRNFLRLTGERQSQKGWVASRTPLAAPEWSATLELRASGTSMHLYGDGAPPAPAPPLRASRPSRGTACAQAWRSGSSLTRTTSRAPSSAGRITGTASASSLTPSRTSTTHTTTSTRTFTPS